MYHFSSKKANPSHDLHLNSQALHFDEGFDFEDGIALREKPLRQGGGRQEDRGIRKKLFHLSH